MLSEGSPLTRLQRCTLLMPGRQKNQEQQSFLDELWTAHSLGAEQQELLSTHPWEKNKQADYLS